MKKILFILFFLGTYAIDAQVTSDTIYYDFNNRSVKKKSQATFYTISKTVGKMKVDWSYDMKNIPITREQFILNPNTKQHMYKKWLLHGPSFSWYAKEVLHQEYNYYYGLKQGLYKEFYPSGELLKKDSFALDSLKSSYFYYKDGREFLVYEQGIQDAKPANEVYSPLLLWQHFMPMTSVFLGKPYDIYIKFTVDTEGHAKDFRIVNCDDRAAYKEMLELVKTLPPLLPAVKNNKPIETSILVPVNIVPVINISLKSGYQSFSNKKDNQTQTNDEIPNQGKLYNEAQRMKQYGY